MLKYRSVFKEEVVYFGIVMDSNLKRGKTLTDDILKKIKKEYDRNKKLKPSYKDSMIANSFQQLTNKQIAAAYYFLDLKDMFEVESVKRAKKNKESGM